MRTELCCQTFEQPIIRNNAELGFEILKNRVNDASRRHIQKRRATINNPSWINNDVKQAIGRRDDIGPLKTLDGIITTDNDLNNYNTMNNYFSSVFTIEQLKYCPTARPI